MRQPGVWDELMRTLYPNADDALALDVLRSVRTSVRWRFYYIDLLDAVHSTLRKSNAGFENA